MRYKYVYFFNISKANFDENKLWLKSETIYFIILISLCAQPWRLTSKLVPCRCFFCVSFMLFLSCFVMLSCSLFVDALWSPAEKRLTSWLWFVMPNCDVVTFPLVSWVMCGTWLYRFLIFAPFLTFTHILTFLIENPLFTLILPKNFILKMLSAFYDCCIHSKALQKFILLWEQALWNLVILLLREQSDPVPYSLQYRLPII